MSFWSQIGGGQGAANIGLGIFGGTASLFSQNRAARDNMRMAKWQDKRNEYYLDKMNEYNTPKNQMARFQDAGLNPHLVYGQGTPGNQSSAQESVGAAPRDWSKLNDIVPLINQTRLATSQVQATNARTTQTAVLTQLNKLQTEVLRKNPALNEAGFKAMIDSLIATAQIKNSESEIKKVEVFKQGAISQLQISKIEKEIELLEQKFNLSKLDAQMKAKLIESQDFKNAILDVQKRFMVDGDLSPGNILQFIQMLIMKSM